ncbi:PREDICTED: uncharacterized protein LOC105148453 [Acromyrmex echinatior]|uniref:uncharacterized protein LOC105148453 n=1 Tax=Acromyrmex echinatior TaxID=103372 RepID=UPI000580DDFA|nr:PREDICTED: uncharacterized protein LOC105148453 [Acromyrmex echinatior]XP_011058487.1 PREDICTED: uncharacterized protein LOC105148453 [Acromyrmex echinatior]XP_011058488.1 PREDICTED: uncharacterized protein LOC105148453 [Acromyrmex echinatior]XP_011058489.1 PREDICTED: uncharacterized protein LOC105148453 [Acromyrmex echinatior]
MIITKSTVTAAAAATTTTTTTTTATATRWPLLQNRETLGRIYHNVGGKRRSTTDLHSDAVSAMLSRNCGRRVAHGNDNSNIIEPQWISDSHTEIVSVLPYYYYCQRLAIISIVASLLVDDDVRGDDLISGRLLEHRDDNNTATSSDDLRLLNRRNDGFLRCCA